MGPARPPHVGGRRRRDQDANPEVVESRLVGLRQDGDGGIEPCPLEHLLLWGARGVAPGGVPLARIAARLTDGAREWLVEGALARLVDEHRARTEQSLPERLEWLARGCDHKAAALIAKRRRASRQARAGDTGAAVELARVEGGVAPFRRRQAAASGVAPQGAVAGHGGRSGYVSARSRAADSQPGRPAALHRAGRGHCHALGSGARGSGGSRRPRCVAPRAGAAGWARRLAWVRPPSKGPAGGRRAIEVKDRAGTGGIELSENECAKACNLRDGYWLYGVYDCATARQRLVRVRDPFAKLLARNREFSTYAIAASSVHAAAEGHQGSER